jgi:hypothetical protein
MSARVQGVRVGHASVGGGITGGPYPTWRNGLTVGVLNTTALAGTAYMSGYTGPSGYGWPEDPIVPWQSLGGGNKVGCNTWWSEAAAGHGSWQNAVLSLDLMSNRPLWVVRKASSTATDARVPTGGGAFTHYLDGTPAATHTYYTSQHISSAAAPDGQERALRLSTYALYCESNGGFGNGAVDGFRVSDNNWDAAASFNPIAGAGDAPGSPGYLLFQDGGGMSQHPTTEKIYYSSGNYLVEYDPSFVDGAGKFGKSTWIHTQPDGSGLPAWNRRPSVVDSVRNRVVCWRTASSLSIVSLTGPTYTVSSLAMSGAVTSANPDFGGICHDRDNDRYIVCDQYSLIAVDPVSGVSTLLNTLATAGDHTTGMFTRLQFFPDLHCVALYPWWSLNVMVLPTT